MTIKDLARLSGYSLGTVSRVLNNQPNVSERARSTILAIAAEHGFELNTSAQSLKQQKSNAVLVVVKGRNNEMFATMVEQLQTLFAATTHPLIVDFIDEDDNEVLRAAHLVRERKPCGLMLLGGSNQYFFQNFAGIRRRCHAQRIVPPLFESFQRQHRRPRRSGLRSGLPAALRTPEHCDARRLARHLRYLRAAL